MPSSPTPPPPGCLDRAIGLAQVLAELPDPRRRAGVRHRLAGLVVLAVTAVVAGARSYTAIGEWVSELTCEQLAQVGLTRSQAPDESTFRRLFARLDAAVLDALLGAFVWTRTATAAAPHLVAAFDHASGTVLGQLATAEKSNEIPTVRNLLACFDLTGVVVTVDAMHTQTDTAQAIVGAGGDFVFTPQGKPTFAPDGLQTPALARHPGPLSPRPQPRPPSPAHHQGHHRARVGRVLRRHAGRPDPPHHQTRRKTTVEVIYVMTSADYRAAPPAALATWVQGHWGIENRAHWVRDVTYDEDHAQVRTGNGPQVMATFRIL